MKLVGLMVVRDEADIIEVTIRHLLRIGIDEVLVADNGSTDGTTRILRRLGRSLAVRWHAEAGAYRQSEITSALAADARASGATWVLPTDADEFWWSARPLRDILAGTEAAALSADVVNFVQHRWQRRPNRYALRRMQHRIGQPAGPSELGETLVRSGQAAFIEIEYVPKWISRAVSGLVIGRGNHDVVIDGPRMRSDEVVLLHAPLRAARILENKAELGRRIREGGFLPGESWHTVRWAEMKRSQLAAEWLSNSHRRGHLHVNGERRALVRDGRLREAVRLALGHG